MNRRSTSAEHGSAILEVAVLAPLMLMLALGGVDYGRIVYEDIAVQSAAYAGAQQGAQNTATAKDIATIEAAVLEELGDNVKRGGVSTLVERYCKCPDDKTISCDGGSCTDGEVPYVYLRVRVNKTFNTLFNYPGIPHEVLLSREAHMRAR